MYILNNIFDILDKSNINLISYQKNNTCHNKKKLINDRMISIGMNDSFFINLDSCRKSNKK